MSLFLVGWSDAFLLESAKILAESGAPVSHISLVMGEDYKGLPGKYGPLLREKGIILLDEMEYYLPDRILSLPCDARNPISAELIEDLTHCENIYLAATDRLSFTPVSVSVRRRLYKRLVHYWRGFLQENTITSIVFSSTPHMGWDLVLYHLAVYLGIRVSYFNRTLIPERILFHEHLDNREKVPEDFLKGLGREELISHVGEPLYSDSRGDSVWAQSSRAINTRMEGGVKVEWKRLLWMIIHNKRKLVNSSFYYDRSLNTHGQLIPAYFRYMRDQKALHALYHGHAKPPDFSKKYVFFALHFQPERSTLPEGGIFEDQLLAAEILSAAMPDDWLLYVKEHPRQFSLRFQSRHGRSEAFYRQLTAMDKVRLIDTREDTGNLARNAALVATVTGSVGWESIQMGKACIAFGNPWYAPCSSCYLVGSAEDCRIAISEIAGKSETEVENDRLRFLARYKDWMVLASTSHEMASKSKVPYEVLALNLAGAIRARTSD